MPEQIVDIDAVVGEPKKVRIHGRVFTLPPDLPVELYLKITQVERQAGEDQIVAMYADVLKLFQDPLYGDPSIRELPIGVKGLMGLVIKVYGEDAEVEGGEQGPPRRRSPGRRTPRRR